MPARYMSNAAAVGAAFLVAALLCLGRGPAAAQGLGSAMVFGEILDEAGQPIPLAALELLYVPTGAPLRTVTNQDGRFQLVNLRPGGPYELTVSALGYREVRRDSIRLGADQRLQLELRLTREAIALEGIEVSLDRRFEISRAGPAVTVDRQVIQTHPTIERSFMELGALSPVAVKTSEEGGLSISGQNERHNAILIDGSLNQDLFGSSSTGMPGAAARAKPIPLDAIEEFRLEVAPFDARTSGFTGGVLNAITRSGTNEWEGSAFAHFRNERFFGDLVVGGTNVAPTEYTRSVWGLTLGGPLRRDVAHLFIAGEFEDRTEPAPGFSLGVHPDLRTRIAADSLARMSRILESGYGLDAGTPRQVSLENPLANLFTRLDLRLGEGHTLTLRHNFSRAQRDSTPNRASFGAYELASVGHRAESTNHAVTGRLVSRFGSGHSNELAVNIQRIDDRSEPNSVFPQIDVRISSEFDDLALSRRARAGSRYFRQYDELDQTLVELTNTLTLSRDEIVSTIGLNLDMFRFDQDHRPGALGLYRFHGLDRLEANDPSYYELNVLGPGEQWATRFNVLQPSVFFQREHRFPPEFVLQYGMRLDVPIFPDRPEFNSAAEEAFDIRTDRLPSGAFLLSPRMGFNWQSQREWITQFRGGWGIFTGRVPFVWMADAYRHTGLRSAILSCEEDDTPGFDPGGPLPQACLDGTDAFTLEQGSIVVFDQEFRYPRELKVTAALDQQLPWELYLSVEGLVVQTHGRTMVRDLNLPAPGSSTDAGYRDAFGLRAQYGTPTELGYRPRRREAGFSHVLRIENDERTAIAWATTIELQKRVAQWLDLTGSVTLAGSDDRQSLVFPDMLSNYASTPVGRQASELGPAPATFNRPRKYLVNARARVPQRWGGAELSLLYVGQSGQVYSYVYGSDINGDGYNGPGIAMDVSNDLVFIPENPARLPATLPTQSLLARLTGAMEACLASVRREIVRRNSCRSPTTHQLDLRVSQPVTLGGARVEVTADLLNVLNLLNSDWGQVWEVDPLVPLLDIVARAEVISTGEGDRFDPSSAPILGYEGGLVRDPESGAIRPTLPYNLITPASQWQAQVGLRVSF